MDSWTFDAICLLLVFAAFAWPVWLVIAVTLLIHSMLKN